MFLLIRGNSPKVLVNDHLDGMTFQELFSYPYHVPARFRFIRRHVELASEMTLITERELRSVALSQESVNELKVRMDKHGLELLPDDASKRDAMHKYYLTVADIPLRMMFFGTRIPDTLRGMGIRTMSDLKSQNSAELPHLLDDTNIEHAMDPDYDKSKLRPALATIDVEHILATLDKFEILMRDQMSLR